MTNIQSQIKKISASPGIYLFYNNHEELLYVGKATHLKNRVNSYFQNKLSSSRPIETFISKVAKIKWRKTDSVLEAIILEAKFINKNQPKFNVLGKDNKSWNYLYLTNETYPKLQSIREHELTQLKKNNWKLKIKNLKLIFGPYPGLNTKDALKILRKIFKYSTCQPHQGKPCFYYELGQCLGVCTDEISSADYRLKVIKPMVMFLRGGKKRLLANLKNKMRLASREENYEEAARLRDQTKNLQKIHDITLLNKDFFNDKIGNSLPLSRIEAYDISNLGADGKVGSLVVFNKSGPIKSAYRKFKIKTVAGQNDLACLAEVLIRRFQHPEWPMPDLILVDGGTAQVNTIKKIYNYQSKIQNPRPRQVYPAKIGGARRSGLKSKIYIVGLAKGKTRKKNEFIFDAQNKKLAAFVKNNAELLIHARDEAHRFALSYQKKLRKII